MTSLFFFMSGFFAGIVSGLLLQTSYSLLKGEDMPFTFDAENMRNGMAIVALVVSTIAAVLLLNSRADYENLGKCIADFNVEQSRVIDDRVTARNVQLEAQLEWLKDLDNRKLRKEYVKKLTKYDNILEENPLPAPTQCLKRNR